MRKTFILLGICLVLFGCAPSISTPEQTGFFYDKPTVQALVELEAKIKQAKEEGEIAEELNLNLAAAQVADRLNRHKQTIKFSNRALELIETIENNVDLKEKWIKDYAKKLPSLLSEQEKKDMAISALMPKKKLIYSYLEAAYRTRGETDLTIRYMSKLQNLSRKAQEAREKEFQIFRGLSLKQAKRWSWMPGGKEQVDMLKRQQEIQMKLWDASKFLPEKHNEFRKNWFKMTKKERKTFVKNALKGAERRYREYCTLRAENILGPKGEFVEIEGRRMDQRELQEWCMEKYLRSIKTDEISLYTIGHLDEEAIKVANELLDKGELRQFDVQQIVFHSAWRSGDKQTMIRTLRWFDKNQKKLLLPDLYILALVMDSDLLSKERFVYLPRAMEEYLEREEAKRLTITSERDRIGFTKRYLPLVSALITYHFQRGNYEKAVSLALKNKSRTLVDLMLTDATFDVSGSKNKETIVSAYIQGKRGITVKNNFLKKTSLFDLELKVAGRVPGVGEIARELPEDTALMEMFTSGRALYIWVISKKGIIGTKRWPISSWELGEKVWNFRAKLTQQETKTEQAYLKISVSSSKTPEGTPYLDIYLENRSYRPISPLKIDLATYIKGKRERALKIDPIVSIVESGKKVLIGHYPIEYLAEGVFSIKIPTEVGVLKKGFALEGGKVIETKEEDKNIRLVRKFQNKNLGDLIFGPFEEVLSHYPHLIISPHGVLHYLPFSALKINEKYAIEKWSINIVPTSSILPLIPDVAPIKKEQALIFGDPNYPSKDFEPLPGARAEAQEISRILKQNTLIFLGDKATETFFKSRTPNAHIIHIASHGVFLPASPMDSFLLFTPDSQNDGRLTAKELFELKLSLNPIIVLSACETGLSQMADGDELLGLNRAFLYAGASALANTLWKIDDEATRLLMSHFYHNLIVGKKPAEAMRLAQLKVLSSEKFKSPIYWAAFMVTGKD